MIIMTFCSRNSAAVGEGAPSGTESGKATLNILEKNASIKTPKCRSHISLANTESTQILVEDMTG